MISPVDGTATVELKIPMRAEYVSIARLTAAGVANRLGFDIEIIEDIKVSLSEVCNRIISTMNRLADGCCAECIIEFILSYDSLRIDFHVDNMDMLKDFMPDGVSARGAKNGDAGVVFDRDIISEDGSSREYNEDNLQLSLITLLMDEFVVSPSENCLVSMKKYLE